MGGEVGRGPGGGRAQAAEAVALSTELLEPLDELEEPPESPDESEPLELPDESEPLELPDESEPLELPEESELESLVEPVSVEPESDFTVEPASALRPLAPEPWSFL